MHNKRIIQVITVCFLLTAPFDAAAKHEKETLKIYLPREITVEGSTPTLGQVAILRGGESWVAKASEIPVGYIAAPEQTVILTRNTVLSRLASSGIPASVVTFSGAEDTNIQRQHQLVTGEQCIREATAYLKDNPPDKSICQFDAIRTPEDLVLTGPAENVKLVCRLIETGVRNQCKVQVAVFANNQEIGRQEVPFRFRYTCRKVVAKTAIAKGELINAENVTVENSVSDYPEPPRWTAPYGLIATRALPANTMIAENMVAAPKPPVLIKRNQSVAIKIENAGLIATATGKAMQDGIVGEYIKVQNVDSKITITAKVHEDGTVEPVF